MWPFIHWNDVDWSATAACFSALLAALVLVWTIRWSYERSRREALAKIANARLEWIEQVRKTSSELLGTSASILIDENVRLDDFRDLQRAGYHVGLLLEEKPSHQRVAELIVQHHEYVARFAAGHAQKTTDSPFFKLEAELQTRL